MEAGALADDNTSRGSSSLRFGGSPEQRGRGHAVVAQCVTVGVGTMEAVVVALAAPEIRRLDCGRRQDPQSAECEVKWRQLCRAMREVSPDVFVDRCARFMSPSERSHRWRCSQGGSP